MVIHIRTTLILGYLNSRMQTSKSSPLLYSQGRKFAMRERKMIIKNGTLNNGLTVARVCRKRAVYRWTITLFSYEDWAMSVCYYSRCSTPKQHLLNSRPSSSSHNYQINFFMICKFDYLLYG